MQKTHCQPQKPNREKRGKNQNPGKYGGKPGIQNSSGQCKIKLFGSMLK